MKGKIDEQGFLRIFRKDENPDNYQHQYCPYQQTFNGQMKNCGCWCPQFAEPKPEIRFTPVAGRPNSKKETGRTLLEICWNKFIYFDYFIDERSGLKEVENP